MDININHEESKIKKYEKGVYYGEIDERIGKQNGFGIMIYFDGKIYQGYWKDGKKNGKGFFLSIDG